MSIFGGDGSSSGTGMIPQPSEERMPDGIVHVGMRAWQVDAQAEVVCAHVLKVNEAGVVTFHTFEVEGGQLMMSVTHVISNYGVIRQVELPQPVAGLLQ